MLAKVQPFPTTAAGSASATITVTYDPTTALPASPFTITPNVIVVDPQTTTMVEVTLNTVNSEQAATWANVPVSWLNPPSSGAPLVTLESNNPSTISFQVPAPTRYFIPWIFNLNINFGSVNNIKSPACYLAKDLGDAPVFTLQYTPGDGSFVLSRNGVEADLVLGSQGLLFNTLPVEFDVVLTGATFAQNPVVWTNTGTPGNPGNMGPAGTPQWLEFSFSSSNPGQPSTLKFSFSEPINNQFTGFQFAVVVNDVTILSPDPILINATIGDG